MAVDGLTRRDFLKYTGMGIAAAAAGFSVPFSSLDMPRWDTKPKAKILCQHHLISFIYR
jgi:anaerobic selenocysteine-containing dehydrogenase